MQLACGRTRSPRRCRPPRAPQARAGARSLAPSSAPSVRTAYPTPSTITSTPRYVCATRVEAGLDVIHGGARGLVLALDDVADRRLGEHRAGRGGSLGEDALGVRSEAA